MSFYGTNRSVLVQCICLPHWKNFLKLHTLFCDHFRTLVSVKNTFYDTSRLQDVRFLQPQLHYSRCPRYPPFQHSRSPQPPASFFKQKHLTASVLTVITLMTTVQMLLMTLLTSSNLLLFISSSHFAIENKSSHLC